NTMLPGTHVSVVVNFGDPWATGRSLPSTSQLPAISVVGPFTKPHFLRVGRSVRAIGAVFPSVFSPDVIGVPAPELVNQIVALENRSLPDGLRVLKDALLARLDVAAPGDTLEHAAVRLLSAQRGGVSIE